MSEVVNLTNCEHSPKNYSLKTTYLDAEVVIKLCEVCWKKIVGMAFKKESFSVEGKVMSVNLEDIKEHNKDDIEEEGSYPCMGKGCKNIIQYSNRLCNTCYIKKAHELGEEYSTLDMMTKDELIEECRRRRIITEKIWTGITSIFGQEGFKKILQYVEARKEPK